MAALILLLGGAVSAASASGWSEILLEHSVRMQSRSQPVRIRFQQDVVPSAQVSQSAKKLVSLDTDTSWKAEFVSPREILITPDNAWRSGENFTVTLNARALPKEYRGLEDYHFTVNIIQQTYDIRFDGMTLSPSNTNEVRFSGTLTTADREDDATIESVLKATLKNQPLAMNWQHSGNGRIHHFSLDRLAKEDREQTVLLQWNTQPIGLADKGKRDIRIPPANEFGIVSIHQLRDGFPQIVVTFTTKLAADQNLNGLVQLNGQPVKSKRDDNRLIISLSSKFSGRAEITVAAGIKDETGQVLGDPLTKVLTVAHGKPQVRFKDNGVILPDNEFLSIPFEAMNVHSVQVTAFEVFDHNIGQFLQQNELSGTENLHRVGRYLWRKTIQLPDATPDKWQSYSLDATELFEQAPGALFRLTLSINRSNATVLCTAEQAAKPVVPELAFKNFDDDNHVDNSSWDYAEDYFNVRGNRGDTNNPCLDSYYRWNSRAMVSRNFMASNIGLIAKADSRNRYHVIATDIASAKPLNNAQVSFYNFQNQQVATAVTDSDGFAEVELGSKPFYLLAHYGNEQGVLRLEANASLPVSHFDVGGQQVRAGLKGNIFAERGVWRPGDAIHLTFVLNDEARTLPENHPVTMRLFDPRNRLVETQTNTSPVGSFYRFDFTTEDEALTGNWSVKAQIGGAVFDKTLKIETVQPNRLKVELTFDGEDPILYANQSFTGHLFSQWLHGATASGLKTEVSVALSTRAYNFNRGADFIFNDPTRVYHGRKQYLTEGKLDDDGYLDFDAEIARPSRAAGMMRANFTTKVFESSGQFSIATQSEQFSPFEHYVGIKLPKGDVARGMLLTDTDHTVDIVSVDAKGNPVALDKISVSLYKIHWRWWWEKGADDLGQYNYKKYNHGMAYDVVETDENGIGSWKFRVSYPTWGRFLVRACDLGGGHCASKVVYIDWPGWAGRAQESKGVGASALTLTTDKTDYQVGDVAHVSLPNAQAGRALVSIENGSGVLRQYWYELTDNEAPIEVPVRADMAPNAYLHVTMIQPHQGKDNDRPIRMYGIVPLLVNDPDTHLNPVIDVPEVWGSEKQAEITVSEQDGKAMTYSLMVVDEGLLGLTRYRTPDLHKVFYAKEALGITTWDLFDDVVGAYGGELERLLALGGGDSKEDDDSESRKKRFPPVVKVLGPFQLAAGDSATHSFLMPQYLGQVRVMVVANDGGAYGSADQDVFVREAINLLPTLPRSISPGESVAIPTMLFRNDPSLSDVTIEAKVLAGDVTFTGERQLSIHFDESNEQIAMFEMTVGQQLRDAQLQFTARAGEAEVIQTVNLPVVSATTPTTQVHNYKIDGGEQHQFHLNPHGIAGSNVTTLSLSGAIPFNLEDRLKYLIRYPHGCIEQTTSSVFPQLYLHDLMPLSEDETNKTEENIRVAINRLAQFQTNGGGFAYWPGGANASEWGTNYAGHFLVEARAAGYSVPDELYDHWLEYQQTHAASWTASNQNQSIMSQAYRLYTLVLANEADLGAMNRLRVMPKLGKTAGLMLSESYYRYGLPKAAESIDTSWSADFSEADDHYTYGSAMRNQAIALRSAVARDDNRQADKLATILGEKLAREQWYSTQAIAYTLLAFSEYLQGNGIGVDALVDVNELDVITVQAEKPVTSTALTQIQDQAATLLVTNKLSRPLYASVMIEGLPKPGQEVAVANKLSLLVRWQDDQGAVLDSVQSLKQGSNVSLKVTVNNDTKRPVDNLALTQIFPSGWEIENQRLQGIENSAVFDYQDIRDDRVMTYFDLGAGESRSFELTLHATYAGLFFLPGIHAEAMYDNTYQAATVGQWVEVTR
ncbi:MAG: MG2 domain-containing protein [Reinekea sp.]